MVKKILLLFISLVLISLMVFYWQFEKAIEHLEQPVVKDAQLVRIEQGTSFYRTVAKLAEQNLMNNSWALKVLVRIDPELAQIKAGVYQLTAGMDSFAVLEKLVRGDQHQFKITFTEGSHFKDWQRQLTSHPYIKQTDYSRWLDKLIAPYKSVEGLLFPDTYHFIADSKDTDIIYQAYQQMQRVKEQVYETGTPFLNWYDTLILASIIEKETAVTEEMPLVASVFYNRLQKNMRLQTDPTIIYGLGDSYAGDIKRSHLNDKNNPYNTYHIKGLPPTPIAMPGENAIKAAIEPAQSEYLYFVASGDGGHVFSKRLADHNKAVRNYLNRTE
ncbi:endolytic transglycosylase MltG [Gayadomonas joobiniege]|uniref:endolytic transglycosylase MltG n=1 Tax=Gayadomonas joobiniege TaxID=1234606 RepID=UPI0003800669|nr:endolytic transglycosylase MltG [Gayadomonas joobiniege]